MSGFIERLRWKCFGKSKRELRKELQRSYALLERDREYGWKLAKAVDSHLTAEARLADSEKDLRRRRLEGARNSYKSNAWGRHWIVTRWLDRG